ncbi:DUF1768-domain-containing protein [Daedalea quercina L-15889]|uniref:DUF1768-domain-containing protein n=1 Tax=Daedalea quercina L-15889 TaxID=1314783 RepID=A0A165N6U6_9APHY|nr:DUF1768-domain-containing protein [Daedalea quercina L-15889]
MALYACAHTLLSRVWSRLFAQTTATTQIRFYNRDEPYFEFTNFAPYAINWNDRTYPTAEHLFQAHKFMLNRPDIAERIRQLPSSRAALEEARRVRRLQRSDWLSVNIRVMDGVLEAKFTQHPLLRDMLLKTGNRELIEDSPVDSFWGCGRDDLGRNELGKALMRLRDKLRTRPMSTDDYFAPSDLLPNQSARERRQALTEAPAGP